MKCVLDASVMVTRTTSPPEVHLGPGCGRVGFALGIAQQPFLDVQTYVGKRSHKEIEMELHAARAVAAL